MFISTKYGKPKDGNIVSESALQQDQNGLFYIDVVTRLYYCQECLLKRKQEAEQNLSLQPDVEKEQEVISEIENVLE